jgi:hypothetical protein
VTIRPTIRIISRERIIILARLALLVFFRGNWVRKSRSDIRPLNSEYKIKIKLTEVIA